MNNIEILNGSGFTFLPGSKPTFAGIDEAEVLRRVPSAWVQVKRDDTHTRGDLAVRKQKLPSSQNVVLREIRTLSLLPVHRG